MGIVRRKEAVGAEKLGIALHTVADHNLHADVSNTQPPVKGIACGVWQVTHGQDSHATHAQDSYSANAGANAACHSWIMRFVVNCNDKAEDARPDCGQALRGTDLLSSRYISVRSQNQATVWRLR